MKQLFRLKWLKKWNNKKEGLENNKLRKFKKD
jgi:hypothetical protein